MKIRKYDRISSLCKNHPNYESIKKAEDMIISATRGLPEYVRIKLKGQEKIVPYSSIDSYNTAVIIERGIYSTKRVLRKLFSACKDTV